MEYRVATFNTALFTIQVVHAATTAESVIWERVHSTNIVLKCRFWYRAFCCSKGVVICYLVLRICYFGP